MKLQNYRFCFDFLGLLFLLVMLPNFVWFAVPAPNDVLRAELATPVFSAVGFTVCHLIFGVVNFV